jgi:Fe-S-cluster-containing dehydrogenase component
VTALPPPPAVKLGLVIDLDICVGCQACVTACKSWNSQAAGIVPLADIDPWGPTPEGAFLNRVHSYEVTPPEGPPQIVHFPRSCLHCDDPPCVTVCPTGASYKRGEDGIVLVDEDACMGCGLCAWACPYGAREMDPVAGVMKKCTLCADRIENANLPEADRIPACVRTCPTGARHFGDLADPDSAVARLVAERGGVDLLPDLGTRPVNKYLPPRPKDRPAALPPLAEEAATAQGFLGWLDRALARLPGG